MFETSKKNKLESSFIVGIFILIITLIVYYICNALELGTFSIIIALILVFLLSMGVLGAIFYLKNKELKFYIDGKYYYIFHY